jgi:DNA-binding NtrC family response regulator
MGDVARGRAVCLVIESDPQVRRAVTAQLESAGFAIVVTENPDGAGEYEAFSTNVVLLSMDDDVSKGLRFIREWKNRKSSPPIIAYSNQLTTRTAVESIKAGVFDYIRYPFNTDELILTIKNAFKAA